MILDLIVRRHGRAKHKVVKDSEHLARTKSQIIYILDSHVTHCTGSSMELHIKEKIEKIIDDALELEVISKLRDRNLRVQFLVTDLSMQVSYREMVLPQNFQLLSMDCIPKKETFELASC